MPGATCSAYLPWLSDLVEATTLPDRDRIWTVVCKGRSGRGGPGISTGQVAPATTVPDTVPSLAALNAPRSARRAPPSPAPPLPTGD